MIWGRYLHDIMHGVRPWYCGSASALTYLRCLYFFSPSTLSRLTLVMRIFFCVASFTSGLQRTHMVTGTSAWRHRAMPHSPALPVAMGSMLCLYIS